MRAKIRILNVIDELQQQEQQQKHQQEQQQPQQFMQKHQHEQQVIPSSSSSSQYPNYIPERSHNTWFSPVLHSQYITDINPHETNLYI